MGTPILLVVDEDQAMLEALAGDLGPVSVSTTRSSPSHPRPEPWPSSWLGAHAGRNKPERWDRLRTTVAPGSDTPRAIVQLGLEEQHALVPATRPP
jgi:hypothetical protein